MIRAFPPASIAVGVGDSKAAVRAAVWAIDGAVLHHTNCFVISVRGHLGEQA